MFLPWYVYVLFVLNAFVQNMAFTWVSRSRNSGDVRYHAGAALCSNGLWFSMQLLIVSSIWQPIANGELLPAIMAGVLYSISTTAGSCLAMHRLLRTEKGLRRVGAYKGDTN